MSSRLRAKGQSPISAADHTAAAMPEHIVANGENHCNLLRCLQTLPEEFRAVVVLRDIEEFGYDKTAEIVLVLAKCIGTSNRPARLLH